MKKNPKKTFIGGLVIGAIIGMILGAILAGNYILAHLLV